MDPVSPSLTTDPKIRLPKGVTAKVIYDYKPHTPSPPPESGSFPGRRTDRFPKPPPGPPVEKPARKQKPRRMKRLGTSDTTPWIYDTGIQYLVRHRPSGIYYGRVRFGRRIVRRSLGTSDLADAKTILPHFLINARAGISADNLARAAVELPQDIRMLDVTQIFLRRVAEDPTLSSATCKWRLDCVKAIRASWPNWDSLKVDEVRPEFVRTWAARLAATKSASYYNGITGTGKIILDLAAEMVALDHSWKNPFLACKKLGVKLSPPPLPEPAQFRAFLDWIDQQPGAREAAKLVRLMSFCGLRVQETHRVEWRHFDWANGELFVYGAKGRRASSDSDTRRVPLIADAVAYFRPLSEQTHIRPSDRIVGIDTMRVWFKKASQGIDFPEISHHDCRHLFATRCIESGVDIPTVSRWLGHKDGGALAMKVYGHLRRTHSLESAKKVTF